MCRFQEHNDVVKHHIVAIGISKHKNSSANLAFAERDASEFFTLFNQNIGAIGYSKLLVDQEATLSEIKTALGKELLTTVGPDDAFFFFYSGHGALVEDPADPNTALSFLVPYDATHDIANTCLSVNDLKAVFESLPSRANLIFVDSCFSGSVAKNGKSYPLAATKHFKTLKSFTNTVVGNGTIVFTASKDDELSLEDPDYEHGLFTYYLLEELQKKRAADTLSAMDIFSPIVSGVTTRAKVQWHHTQTPTFSGKLEGDMTLPVFKKPLSIRPETIEIPKTPALLGATFSIPDIALTDAEKGNLVQNTIDFVISSSGATQAVRAEVEFERLCHKLTRKVKSDWEQIFQEPGIGVAEIPAAISKFEASSYQLMILGGAATVFGGDKQMQAYSQHLVSLLELTKNRSGLTALIAVPEVPILEALYLVAILCIARGNYKPLEILLDQTFDDPEHPDRPPMRLLEYKYLHYTRSLGGYSTTVNEHLREYLKHQEWLIELVPSLEGKTDDYQMQANFLLSMLTEHVGDHLWPDYARFYPQRVWPLARKLVFDKKTREQVGTLIGLKESEVLPKLRQYMSQQRQRGLDNYFWSSITGTDLMTEQEKKATTPSA
jgi:hypothetical protein